MALFSCSTKDAASVLALVGDDNADAVQSICAKYDVASLGATTAVLKHLMASQAAGINASFVLFSGYLVFLMQAGFALVSSKQVVVWGRSRVGSVVLPVCRQDLCSCVSHAWPAPGTDAAECDGA